MAEILTAAPESLDIDAFITQGNAIAQGEEIPAAPPEDVESTEVVEDTPTAEPEPSKPAPAQEEADVLATNPDGTYKVKASPKKRIDAAITKQREAERKLAEAVQRAADAERRLTERREPDPRREPAQPIAAVPAVVDDPEPTLEQFAKEADPYSAWMRATAKWEGRNESRRLFAENNQHAAQVAAGRAWQARLTETRKAIPDFDQRIKADTPVDSRVMPYIQRQERGPEILLYLSEHPQDAQALLSLHPVEQIGAIGEIIGQLKSRTAAAQTQPAQTPKPQPISQAQPPHQPVGGSPVVSSDAEDEENLPVEEFIRRGNKKDPRLSVRR